MLFLSVSTLFIFFMNLIIVNEAYFSTICHHTLKFPLVPLNPAVGILMNRKVQLSLLLLEARNVFRYVVSTRNLLSDHIFSLHWSFIFPTWLPLSVLSVDFAILSRSDLKLLHFSCLMWRYSSPGSSKYGKCLRGITALWSKRVGCWGVHKTMKQKLQVIVYGLYAVL